MPNAGKINLKKCPFCGTKPPEDLIDTLYPSGIWWRALPGSGIRSYHSHADRKPGDNPCYRMGCDVHNGGCGAKVSADSKEEVIAAWNTRPKNAIIKWLEKVFHKK